MHFDFNDEQREIKDTARNFLAERSKPAKVREHAEARTHDEELWKALCELGWAGIAIPEEHGGQGLGMVELASLCEELGYACAPVPFLSNAATGLLISSGGSDEQKAQWLPGIASGEARGAAAFDDADPALVVDATGAAVLALPAGPGSARLVQPEAATTDPLELIDATRSFARVSAEGGEELEASAAICRTWVALAAELTGVAQKALDMAVEYARDRQQFGRAIGAYQGVSHRCAQMLYDVEESRSLTYYAAWTADAEPESLALAAHMAKARASEAAWAVTTNALQVFGGIGFTWENDLQFWLKRARVAGELLGTAGEHRDSVAELAGLGSSEPVPA
jgi:alkylation response protein AidB-like acyl-CoA dehydrogenase